MFKFLIPAVVASAAGLFAFSPGDAAETAAGCECVDCVCECVETGDCLCGDVCCTTDACSEGGDCCTLDAAPAALASVPAVDVAVAAGCECADCVCECVDTGDCRCGDACCTTDACAEGGDCCTIDAAAGPAAEACAAACCEAK